MLRSGAWGIDCSGGTVQAVHVRRRGRRYYVDGAVEIPYSSPGKGVQPPSVHLASAAQSALRSFLSEHGGALADPVFVGMPGYGSFQGQIQAPPLSGQKARDFVTYELHRILPADPEEFVIRLSRPSRARARDEWVSYFAHRRAAIHTFAADLEQTGLPFDGLVPEAIALQRFLEVEWSGGGSRLAWNIGRTRTDLVSLTEAGMRFRTLPLGVGGLSGYTAGHRTPPTEEVQALASAQIRELKKACKQFFGFEEGAFDRVMLLGEGATLPRLHHVLQQQVPFDLSLPSGLRWFELSPRLSGAAALDVARMGTALGLAVAALRSGGEDFSLMTPPAARRSARRRPAMTAACLAMAAALFVVRLQTAAQLETSQEMASQLNLSEQFVRQDQMDQVMADGEGWQRIREGWIRTATSIRDDSAFPRAFLGDLSLPTAFSRMRLRSLEVGGENGPDEFRAVFEIPDGLGGAAKVVRDWLAENGRVRVSKVTELSNERRLLVLEVKGSVAGASS